MRIENVLVPVDFSPPSRLAVNYGVSLARTLRAQLTLLHVIESSTALMYAFPTESERLDKKHQEQAWRMLQALVAPEDQDDLDLQILLKPGGIEEQISESIREERADIVVMGTHGRGLIGRWLIGSVTQHILRKSGVPVLTVCRVTRPLTFKQILFATALSGEERQGFRFALELARTTGSDLAVVHAVQEPSVTTGGGEMAGYAGAAAADEARAKVSEFADEATQEKVNVETAVLHGVPAEVILKKAEENCADLIVITVKSKGMIERALLGSTAERLIREAHVPVLSVPPARQL